MKGIEDSARSYMVSLAQVRAARKLSNARQVRTAAPVAAVPPAGGPSQPDSASPLQDAICCLLGVREMLIQMGHSKDGRTIQMIDRALRRRHE
jgi:hypothetical protein